MDLRTGARAEVPNPGAFQRAPSVTRAGTVFFVRSGRNCGESVRLMRYAPGAPPKELVRLPAGEDIDDTYAYSRARSPTKVFYERNSCTRAYVSDVWAVRHARLFTLGVTTRGAGGGTVTSVPAGVTCGSDCAEPFRAGTTVTLEARPQSTSNFTGWGGACSGHARKCTVAMSRARSVAVFFDTASSFSLSVTKKGRGRGRVTSDPPGIACGRDCWEAFSAGTRVTLRAAAARGSQFHEWRGACSGRRRCTLTVDRVRSVTAVFVRARRRTSAPVPDHMLAPGASPARAS
jgi:hypothetical protein